MKIMKVKQADGSIVSIPLGQGANGKSAYEYAKDGGYTGTEAEFAILLASIGSGGGGGASTAEITAAIAAHNVNTSAHSDIRETLDDQTDTYVTKTELEDYVNDVILTEVTEQAALISQIQSIVDTLPDANGG